MQQQTVRGFSVSTRCETVEDFVAKFRDRCDDNSIVVNVLEPRAVGTECAFAILLANKQPVLAGTCVVLDVFTDTNNAFKRRGMRLGIKRLGVTSEDVFAKLTRARTSRKPTELGVRAASPRPTMAMSIVSADVALDIVAPPRTAQRMAAVQIPPLETPRVRARQSSSPVAVLAEGSGETRTPGSRFVLPANPLSNIDDAALADFVDFESHTHIGPAPVVTAAGTIDRAIDDDPTRPVEVPLPSVVLPLPPLPPPPQIPYAATKLPDLDVGEANDDVRPPVITRRVRKRLLLAVAIVPALGAALLVATMAMTTPAGSALTLAPSLVVTAETSSVRTIAHVEAAPAAPPAAAKRPVVVKRRVARKAPIDLSGI